MVIVAHRTSVLATIDQLMVLRDGRIEMAGPRDEVTQALAARRAPPSLTPNANNNASIESKEPAE